MLLIRQPRILLPQTTAQAARIPGLRHLWNFADKSGACLITGQRLTLATSASYEPDGTLFSPSSSNGGVPTTLPLSFHAAGPIGIVIASRRTLGTVNWSLMNPNWDGWYETDGTILSTNNTDFSGSVAPTAGNADALPIRATAMTMSGANDLRASIGGGAVTSDTSCAAPTPTDPNSTFRIGTDGASTNGANVYVSFVALFDRPLSDDELIRYSAQPFASLFEPRRIWVPVNVAAGGGGAVGLATETDTALGLSGVQILGTGLAAETDTALALAAVSARAAGLASEVDSAFALAAKQITGAGLAVETDTAFALAAGTPNGVGLAEETDTAFALAAKQIKATGLAIETDTALPLTVTVARQAGLAAENDSSFALAAVQRTAVGLAIETDSAFALGGGEAVSSAGGGGDDDPAPRARREPRRYVVRNGDELLVFTDEREAQAAQQAIDEWDARQEAKPGASAANEGRPVPKRRKAAAALPTAIHPLDAIPLPDLRSLAAGYGMQAIYDQAMSLRNLETAAALWQQLRDEEDEAEMLLLAA